MARTTKSIRIAESVPNEQIVAKLTCNPVWVTRWNRYAAKSTTTGKVYLASDFYACRRLLMLGLARRDDPAQRYHDLVEFAAKTLRANVREAARIADRAYYERM